MTAAPLSVPGPLLFFAGAMTVALVCYLVHRWTWVSGIVAVVGTLLLAWVGWQLLLDGPVTLLGRDLALHRTFAVLGREWALTGANTALLTLLFSFGGLAFLFALPASQGWSFYPFGLAVLAMLGLSITAQQHIYRVLFLWLAANLATFVLAGGRPGATMGALRFMILTTLGVMPLLILPRYLALPADPALLQTASVLMIIGLAILFMMPPFHGQLVGIGAYSTPMAPAFILSTFLPTAVYLLAMLGQSHPDLLADGFFFDICRWLGVGAVAIGGLGSLGQRRWGALLGYAALVDWGAGLVALGQGTPAGVAQLIQMLIWRAFSLLMAGAGLTVLFQAAGKKDDLDQFRGALYRQPLNVLLLIGGLFSLGGFPFTPGALGRWPLIVDLLAASPRIAWVLILGGVGVGIGALKGLHACLGAPAPQTAKNRVEMTIAWISGFLAVWLLGYLFIHSRPWMDVLYSRLADLIFLGSS